MRAFFARAAALAIAAVFSACEHDPLPGGTGNAFRVDPYLGEWTGTWTNTTTNTSGPASFIVEPGDDDTLRVTVDLDGNVFGAGDPPAETFVLTVGASNAVLTAQNTPTYGSLTGRLEADGAVIVQAENVSIGNVRAFSIDGDWRSGDIDFEVTITYVAGSTPETARSLLRLTKQ
jgi:hypothetical protein